MYHNILEGLRHEIEDVARRKIRAHNRRTTNLRDENSRRKRRSTATVEVLTLQEPSLWDHKAHNPHHVLRNANSISNAITKAVKAGDYRPLAPRGFEIRKADGTMRRVGVFALADEVLSKRVYNALMSKNLPRLSARSYAYRQDRGVHDALSYIDSEWRLANRLFVAEYDFAQYFDELSHEHIESTIDALRLSVTSTERSVLNSILTAPLPQLPSEGSRPHRTRGVPLGTSASLFLANVAATPLDRSLERIGVNFTRFADDVLLWSRDYSSMCAASDIMHDFARSSGTRINTVKSEGIRLLLGEGSRGEMRSTRTVVYLSHELALGKIGFKKGVIEKILKEVDRLVYDNLLREPLKGQQSLGRLTSNDRDYVTLVWQLRRLLYGRMSEEQVRRLAEGRAFSRVQFSGMLAHFALVDDQEPLRYLDGQIASKVWLALRRRKKLLLAKYPSLAPIVPWSESREGLESLQSSSRRSGAIVDLRLPSAVRYVAAAQNSVQIYGTSVLGRSSSFYSQ